MSINGRLGQGMMSIIKRCWLALSKSSATACKLILFNNSYEYLRTFDY